MSMVGDDPKGQPTEGVDTLADLTALLDGGEEREDGTPVESEEGELPDEAEGEEDGSEEEGDEEEQEEATIVLKHEGKEVSLKQSEVVELAQKGFDYSQKTMAVAEERKAVEAQRSQVETYRQEVEQARTDQLTKLQALEQFYEGQIGSPPPVEWAQQDVAYYIAQKEQYEARKGQLEQARSAIGYLQQEQARSRQAWIVQQADATEAALKDTLPGWSEATLPELADYAKKLGLTPQSAELAFVHKGFWEALHKAKAYDQLLEKKAQMKPVSELKKVAPPTARNQPPQLARRAEAEKAYAAKPSINTLANLL